MAYPIKMLPESWQKKFPWPRYQRLHRAVGVCKLDEIKTTKPLEPLQNNHVLFLKNNFGNTLDGVFDLGSWIAVLLPTRWNPYYQAQIEIRGGNNPPFDNIIAYDNAVKERLIEKRKQLAKVPANESWGDWFTRFYQRWTVTEEYYTLYPNKRFLTWLFLRNAFLVVSMLASLILLFSILGPVCQAGVFGSVLANVSHWGVFNFLIHMAFTVLSLPFFLPLHLALYEFPLIFVALFSFVKFLGAFHVLCFDDHDQPFSPLSHSSVVWQNKKDYDFKSVLTHYMEQWKNTWKDVSVLRLSDERPADNVNPSTKEILIKTLLNPVRWFRAALKGLEYASYVLIDLSCSVLGKTIGAPLATSLKSVLYFPLVVTHLFLEAFVNLVDVIPKIAAQAFTIGVYWPALAGYRTVRWLSTVRLTEIQEMRDLEEDLEAHQNACKLGGRLNFKDEYASKTSYLNRVLSEPVDSIEVPQTQAFMGKIANDHASYSYPQRPAIYSQGLVAES